MRIFGDPTRMKALMTRVGMKAGEAIESGMLTRQIERAQRRVEQHNFDARKQLLEYDDVANDQRRVIYQQRTDLMSAADVAEAIKGIREDVVAQLVDQYVPGGAPEEQWDVPGLGQAIERDFGPVLPVDAWAKAEEAGDGAGLRQKILTALEEAYEQKQISVGPEVMRYIEKEVMLRTLDQHWREHLAAMDYMRQGIFLRSYAQKNPKQEYKREAFELFSAMLDRIKFDTVTTVSKIQVRSQAEIEREEFERQQRLARALQMQHAEAVSPIQATPDPNVLDGARPNPSTMSWSSSRARAGRRPRPSCARCPRWDAMNPVPVARGASTSTVTAPCSKRTVEFSTPPAGSCRRRVVFDESGRLLIAQRPEGKHLAGGWEFPGGKLEPGEERRAGLARELHEELGHHHRHTPRPLIRVRHAYPTRDILLDVWVVHSHEGEPQGLDGQALRWCTREELAAVELLPADGPIVRALWLPERLRERTTLHYRIGDLGSPGNSGVGRGEVR